MEGHIGIPPFWKSLFVFTIKFWLPTVLVYAFCHSGGIKKELAAAKKKASDFSLYDSLIAHVDFFFKLSVYVINSYNHLQIADRRDQEKKAYSRMFQ